MFKFLEGETQEREKKRGFATQILVGSVGALFAGALVALMGWNARTNVEIKEELSGMNEVVKDTAEDTAENEDLLDAQDRRIREQLQRLRRNSQEIKRNSEEIERNRSSIRDLEKQTRALKDDG